MLIDLLLLLIFTTGSIIAGVMRCTFIAVLMAVLASCMVAWIAYIGGRK